QDHRVRLALLDRAPERRVGTEDVHLADEVVEHRRPHANRERLLARRDRRSSARARPGVARVEKLLHARILAAAATYTRLEVPDPEQLERRTTELLQQLIRFNTVNPPGNEQAAQEFLKATLEGAGFEVELLAAAEGRPNLVARLAGRSDG